MIRRYGNVPGSRAQDLPAMRPLDTRDDLTMGGQQIPAVASGMPPSEQANLGTSEYNVRHPVGGEIPPMSKDDYVRMLAASTGELVAQVSMFRQMLDVAQDRSQVIMVNTANFGADIALPNAMKSMIFARPTKSEQLTPFGADLFVSFDDGPSYKVPPTGLTVLPLASQARAFKVTSASVPPAGWALYVAITNRLYMVGVNL